MSRSSAARLPMTRLANESLVKSFMYFRRGENSSGNSFQYISLSIESAVATAVTKASTGRLCTVQSLYDPTITYVRHKLPLGPFSLISNPLFLHAWWLHTSYPHLPTLLPVLHPSSPLYQQNPFVFLPVIKK